jgi:acyl-CoA synthetase (AMP-forming)/AMP-acid ligase II
MARVFGSEERVLWETSYSCSIKVFSGGFSPDALRDRIQDADCRTVITADEGVRGGKPVALKQNVDKALASCPNVSTVLVVERTGATVNWSEGRDLKYQQALDAASDNCPPEPMDAEDPLFILYTSGSTVLTFGQLARALSTFCLSATGLPPRTPSSAVITVRQSAS